MEAKISDAEPNCGKTQNFGDQVPIFIELSEDESEELNNITDKSDTKVNAQSFDHEGVVESNKEIKRMVSIESTKWKENL